jgi:hypothetical protein
MNKMKRIFSNLFKLYFIIRMPGMCSDTEASRMLRIAARKTYITYSVDADFKS